MKYRCMICGHVFSSLSEWYRHLLSQHPDEEPGWAFLYRMEGRRVSRWKVYLDLRREEKVEVVRGE
jgi:hypothetical protein